MEGRAPSRPTIPMESDGRRHPVHMPLVERFNTPNVVFLTVCTKNRKQILLRDTVHAILLHAWQTKPQWLVGRYVVMPDHLHLFCGPAEFPPKPLHEWVKFWKSHAARHWLHPSDAPIWQREFWDTQLRRGESYSEKWNYVVNNPVPAGLIDRAEDWPYQGELNVLRWIEP